LTGKSPFEGKSFQEILNKNKKCIIDYTAKALKKISSSAYDLLKKMLEIDPTKRPSAVDCLSHDFFIENDVLPVEVQEDNQITDSLKNFQEKYKFNTKSIKNNKPVGDSIEFRTGVINGKTDTVTDSVDFASKGNIYSLHNVKVGSKGGAKPEVKRESIYKHALMQHATILQQENYDTENASDSETEEDGSNKKKTKKSTLNQEISDPNVKRKSKFGNN